MEITSQLELEQLFNKYQLHSAIKHEFIDAGFMDALEAEDIDPIFGLDLLAQIYLHKRTDIPIMVGILAHHFQHEENPYQACSDALLDAIAKDVLDWDPLGETLVVKFPIPEEAQDRIDMYQYPLPMVHEPNEVRHNRQTGYDTIKGSLILRNNHHDEDICLDHINRSNQIALSLDSDVVAFIQNQWKNHDRRKDGESREDFRKRVKAFDKYDRTSRDVLAALMAQGDRFWLTHKYDKRGRTYAQGYHVNPQGNDWNKACVEFANKEKLS